MSVTITATGSIVKPTKPRKATVKVLPGMRTSKGSEKRDYPKWREGMSTRDYIAAYHAANATVNLTTVEYACQ